MALRPRGYQGQSAGSLSADQVRMVAREVARVLRDMPYPGGPASPKIGSHGGGGGPSFQIVKGVVTTAIGPCVETSGPTYTYGQGACQLVYTDNPDATVAILDAATAVGGENGPAQVLNWYKNDGNSIPIATLVWLIATDTQLWFFTADCP